MAVLSLIALLAVDNPPYYRLKFKKRTEPVNAMVKVQDYSRSNKCNSQVYKVRTIRIDTRLRIDRYIL